MSRKIDINSPEWCNIVFEGKNKDYGAYELRQKSNRRHVKALIILVVLFVFVLFLPKLIDKVIPEIADDKMTEVTKISTLNVDPPNHKEEIIIELPPPVLKSSIKFTPPVIKPDDQVAPDDEIKTQASLNETKINISIATVKGDDDDSTAIDVVDLDKNKAITGTTEDKDSTYKFVDQMPEFPGGEKALLNWLNSHIRYPYSAIENEIEGKVYVQFVVDKKGNVGNAFVYCSVEHSLDQEALRVVNDLPRWNPGKQGGVPVKVSFIVPISFVLVKK
jgi:periplasmic protein TonB